MWYSVAITLLVLGVLITMLGIVLGFAWSYRDLVAKLSGSYYLRAGRKLKEGSHLGIGPTTTQLWEDINPNGVDAVSQQIQSERQNSLNVYLSNTVSESVHAITGELASDEPLTQGIESDVVVNQPRQSFFSPAYKTTIVFESSSFK